MKMKLLKGETDKKEKACPYAKMKKKSKWGTDKNEKKHLIPLQNWRIEELKNSKGGKDKKIQEQGDHLIPRHEGIAT
jgi:hypothetical protein